MVKFLSASLLLLGTALASCQPTPTASSTDTPTTAPADTATLADAPPLIGAPTEADAHAAVARYIKTLPNANLYVPDSARALDVDTHWQVLVPRTDWASRMPNKAAFEVDKSTGTVTTRPVK